MWRVSMGRVWRCGGCGDVEGVEMGRVWRWGGCRDGEGDCEGGCGEWSICTYMYLEREDGCEGDMTLHVCQQYLDSAVCQYTYLAGNSCVVQSLEVQWEWIHWKTCSQR